MATVNQSSRELRVRDYFGTPTRYLNGNFRLTVRAEIVQSLLGDTSGKRIVDLGCGDGAICEGLNGSLTLIDQSPAMIAAARKRIGHRATYRCSDIHDIAPDTFDIALCIGVLAHVDDTARTLAAARRALRDGGLLVLQLTDVSHPLGRLNAFLTSISGKLDYRRTALADVLADAAGFDLVACRRHFIVPAGLQRLLGRAMLPIERIDWGQGADAMLLLRKHHFTE